MKNYQTYVGIDISKEKLDVVILGKEDLIGQHFIVENTVPGIKQIVKKLKGKALDAVLFCCENTGIYTFPLSIAFTELGLDYWIVPAIEIKRSKGISRGKNDKVDARDIALYSLRNIDKLVLSKISEKDIIQLKLLYTEREKLSKAIRIFECSSEMEDFVPKHLCKAVLTVNSTTIKALRKAQAEIEKKINEIIRSNQQLLMQMELIKSIPGVGPQTAIYMIIATKGFTAFKSWRKFACYAGVAPFEHTSGSSIRYKTRVSHFADKKMKSLLQMCVLSTIKYDGQIKEYYQRKKQEGKHTMLIMNNIRCKLISRIFAVVQRQSAYVNTYKFAS